MLAKACATLAVIGTAAAYTPTLVSNNLLTSYYHASRSVLLRNFPGTERIFIFKN
jgi:hypothetical protein